MASYADMAAKGPKQSPEERAPALPELEHSDASTHSLVDVDSPHVSSVPSDFESQTIKTETQAARIEFEEEQERVAEEVKKEQKQQEERSKQEKAKAKAQKAGEYARDNANNPVLLGNSVVVVSLVSALGFGAYRKYRVGELNWTLVGITAGAVGLFAAADYYLSKYLFKQYPTKK